MKSSKTLWATLVLAGIMYCMPAKAEYSSSTLSDAEWAEITENIELENMLDFDVNPAMEAKIWQPLHLNLAKGAKANFQINAPFHKDQQVGVAIVDEDGEVVYQTSGRYGDVKNVNFKAYYNLDHVYVIRVYTADKVHETSMNVVYR